MSQNILTAVEIDSNKQLINTQIEQNIIIFNKSRIKQKVKELKEKLKLEFPDDITKHIITKDELIQITTELINDIESNNYREYLKEELQIKKENYSNLRQVLNGLNDLDEFSSEVELNQIQKIDNFLFYNELINFLLSKINLYHSIIEKRKKSIEIHIESFKDKNIKQEEQLDFLILLRNLYKIDKKIDDLDIFEKFGMDTNIDISNKLSIIYFKSVSENENKNNIINEFDKQDTFVSKLFSRQIITNRMLALLLSNKGFISNNLITCMQTMYTNNTNNELVYCTRTLGELFFEITNEELENIDKQYRQQIYMTYDGIRPTTDEYHKWNGLQVFDIDLKYWEGSITVLKKMMYDYLIEFNWFLWICKSASGKGIHIYTKVSPPHHIYTKLESNEYISKYWFFINYYTKQSIIYDILFRLNKTPENHISFPANYFNEDSNYFELTNKIKIENEYKEVGLDNSVGRITSGIRLTYDPNPLINHNFIDLHIGLNLTQTLDGFNYQETINRVLFRESKIAKKFKETIDTLAVKDLNDSKEIKQEIDLSKYVTIGADLSQLKPLPKSQINYQLRYNVCNTLAALFGNDGLSLAHIILDSTVCKNVGEINSFYACALNNTKKPTKFGLDILKKCGIVKQVEPELKEIVNNNFKYNIKLAIENVLNNQFIPVNIELKPGEFLSDKKNFLNDSKSGLINSKINIIFSPPNTGKTEFVKNLARDGKRILLVLPYISVIKNKIETDPEIMEMFECYYGSKDIKQIEYGINAVTTFDKFSRANYEKISKIFDFIFIDESHLLFTSSYRIEATSQAIKKIKELFYISSNDPFSAKICLMTGTETGESYFFNSVANIIRISKNSLTKTMEFIICDDILDCTTRMASKIYELIQSNHKILVPTNKGEIYTEKIIGMIEYLLGRQLKYGYYKRSNTEQEICRLINDNNTIGDYEIVFCSNYLSVGVDINDRNLKFASIYLGNFSGYEIEQFNSRIRKNGITSIYCLQTEKSDGSVNDLLIEEPDLLLRITEEDKENFIDDKAIAGAKQEFIAQFDPVLHKITTPGFSYLHGKISFNLEEYELTSFETKYTNCMQHPVKVARELNKYGYKILVSTEFEGLEISKQEELKSIGIAAAKEEKIRKHSLLVGTFCDLIEKNSYTNKNGLEFTDIIGWIGKHPNVIIEDRDIEDFIHIEFDIFATPTKVICKSKEALDAMYKSAKYLASKYSVTKSLDIIKQYVDENGIIKLKNFQRAINLLRLVESSDANELSEPLTKILEKIYDFVDSFEISKDIRISYNTYKATLDEWVNMYIDMLGISINTQYAFEKLQDGISEMLYDIATKSTGKTGLRFEYNKLPDQNSNSVLNRRSVDGMIETMFRLSSDAIIANKTKRNPRQKHILLLEQNF
jgi:hypothetical protein